MPESFSSKFDNSIKNETISPRKKDYSDLLKIQEASSKNNAFKNNSHCYPSMGSNNLNNTFSANSFKGMNFSMGADFKEKFNSMNGQ